MLEHKDTAKQVPQTGRLKPGTQFARQWHHKVFVTGTAPEAGAVTDDSHEFGLVASEFGVQKMCIFVHVLLLSNMVLNLRTCALSIQPFDRPCYICQILPLCAQRWKLTRWEYQQSYTEGVGALMSAPTRK